jgi:HEAT repeat protein
MVFFNALTGIAPLLLAPTPRTRVAAAQIAYLLDGREGITGALAPTLIRLLASTDPVVRGNAGEALGRSGAKAITRPLIDAIVAETDEDGPA